VFDAWDHLVAVRDAKGTTIEHDAYDPYGRRILQGNGRQSTELLYSPDWQVLEERDARTGRTKAQNVWSEAYIDALVERDRDADHVQGNGLEERVYAQQDANFNTTALIGTDGAVLQRYDYKDPYGTPTTEDASGGFLGQDLYEFAYLHQGGRYDGFTGLYYFRNRDYSPTLGRWVEQDPDGYMDGLNPYLAVADNPAISHDPFGLWRWVGGQRQGKARAMMIAENGDTVQTAAAFAHLSAIESDKWLRNERTQSWVSPAGGITPGYPYSVPNRVYVTVADVSTSAKTFYFPIGAMARWWANWFAADSEAAGFEVIKNYKLSETAFRGILKDPNTFGWYVVGHGHSGVIALSNGLITIADDTKYTQNDLHHQWGFAYIDVCEAGRQAQNRAPQRGGIGWEDLVSEYGKLYCTEKDIKVTESEVPEWKPPTK
jgi:RHS repeat-associated protein